MRGAHGAAGRCPLARSCKQQQRRVPLPACLRLMTYYCGGCEQSEVSACGGTSEASVRHELLLRYTLFPCRALPPQLPPPSPLVCRRLDTLFSAAACLHTCRCGVLCQRSRGWRLAIDAPARRLCAPPQLPAAQRRSSKAPAPAFPARAPPPHGCQLPPEARPPPPPPLSRLCLSPESSALTRLAAPHTGGCRGLALAACPCPLVLLSGALVARGPAQPLPQEHAREQARRR